MAGLFCSSDDVGRGMAWNAAAVVQFGAQLGLNAPTSRLQVTTQLVLVTPPFQYCWVDVELRWASSLVDRRLRSAGRKLRWIAGSNIPVARTEPRGRANARRLAYAGSRASLRFCPGVRFAPSRLRAGLRAARAGD